MMREIKFRAWNPESKIMTEGLEISHLMKEEAFVLANPSDSYMFMQYTELKDKNEVEIYEGDIVSNGFLIFTVEWNRQNSAFWIFYQKHTNLLTDLINLYSENLGNGYLRRRDLEVIGNIHQNPELL